MATILLRQNFPDGLSIAQIDGNFTSLNENKVEKTDTFFIGTTQIPHNRASGALSLGGVDIPAAGVRPDTAPNGKVLKLVDGVSTWSDDSVQALTDDTTTDGTFYPLFVNATTGAKVVKVSSSKLTYNPSTGQIGATNLNSTSDANLKINRTQITDAVTTVNKLNGVEFNWKDNGLKSSGVIAQELEQVLPHLVSQDKFGVKSVNYLGIIGYLIEAVKELDAKVKSLEDK